MGVEVGRKELEAFLTLVEKVEGDVVDLIEYLKEMAGDSFINKIDVLEQMEGNLGRISDYVKDHVEIIEQPEDDFEDPLDITLSFD